MPLITTIGAASARLGGIPGSYNKAAMLTTGAGAGTVTSNAAGYALSGFAVTAYAYLNAGKTSSKWYWETTSSAGSVYFGIADDVVTAVSAGGFNTANAGIYTGGISLWVDGGWAGGSVGAGYTGPFINPTDTVGFALDMDSATKTLKLYTNNTLSGTISWTGGATTLWPMLAFQPGVSGQIKLGPGCTYAPPSGYTYI